MKKKRRYKCKADDCQNTFEKFQGDLRQWCSPGCGASMALQKLKKKKHKEHQERKRSIRPLSAFHRQAKEACHRYIRERDKDLPCVSCGRVDAMEWHAGHYLESGNNPAVRYDERNIHKQCSACNTHKGGNTADYRIELVKRIGLKDIEQLEAQRGHGHKWTRGQLTNVADDYRSKYKMLTK